MKLTSRSPIKQSGRWIWVSFFLFVVLPLYVITITLFIRSGLFRFNGGSLSDQQLKAVWTFLGAGLAASATILGALLTKSYNDKNLTAQNLNTVVSALGLISNDGQYSTGAATAAGLATLVQLGHPIVAMRALRPAFEDNAVNSDTFTWLISKVITSDRTTGTPRDLEDAKAEAVGLLYAFAGERLIDHNLNQFSWPEAFAARWPSGLSSNGAITVMYSLVNLLTAESKEWWETSGGTFTWTIYTLDEIVQQDPYERTRAIAAELGLAILGMTDKNENIVGPNDVRSQSVVAKRMASQNHGSGGRADPSVLTKIQTWGRADPLPSPVVRDHQLSQLYGAIARRKKKTNRRRRLAPLRACGPAAPIGKKGADQLDCSPASRRAAGNQRRSADPIDQSTPETHCHRAE